ncbi:hypothetical protein ABBQ38_010314 [Trebouxia sp. C0009 RCD-2024]
MEAADDGTVEEMSNAQAISVRFGIMAVVVLVAALSFQVLGSVESIVGAVCSMSSSMLLPGFFYLRIHREELGRRHQYAVMLFLGIGCMLAVTIVHNNITALIHEHGSQPTPHPPSTLSQYALAPLFRTRKFLQV